MPTQIFTFVALPNGMTPTGDLQLSIYFAPRLTDGATLSVFPDMLHWAGSIATKGLQFQLQCNGQSTTVAVDQKALRPGIWNSIFRPATIVQPFTIPPLDQQILVSYPHREALAYVKHLYQVSGLATVFPVKSDGNDGRSPIRLQLEDLLFRDGDKSTLDLANSETRLELWREQNARFAVRAVPGLGTTVAGTTTIPSGSSPLEAPLDGVPTTLNAPEGGRAMARRFALYHHLPPAPNRPPLPSTPADFANLLDFHKAMTAVSSYPQLMRALGLVFDLTIPSSFCPVSPAAAGGAYLTIAVTGVTPGFDWAITPQFCLPQTFYYRTTTDFLTAPATASSNLAAQDYVPGDIVEGVLALLPRYFHLSEVDVDGGLLKAMSLADNLDSYQLSGGEAEIDETLPSLRSAGLGLVANHRAEQFLQAIQTNKTFDAALQKNQPLPPFNAMDVTRGFRIDIWSSLDNRWHSLHRRDGTYHFSHPKEISLHTHDEEGFIQLAVAQPAQEPSPPTNQAATKAGAPQPSTDVRIHERVVKWEGWSLSVPRPGGALNRSPDPAKALDSDPTMNEPMTPFKMKASFEAVKGSLPRLRFGARYRLRARAVDLAGNSIAHNKPEAGEVVAPIHGQIPYFRYEPVPHPILVLRHPVSNGGSMERLVIRSFNTRPELDHVDTEQTDQRHFAPPKTAVRMAEQHGMFDTPHGLVKGDAATYQLIARRDRGQIPAVDKTPMDAAAQLVVDYFPDPIARGVALQNLPNTPDNSFGQAVGGEIKYKVPPDLHPQYAASELAEGSFTHIDFGTHWPAREAFRLVLSEGSAAPAWNASGRVLRVGLPKAGIVQVSMSSYLNAADLSLTGVWDWIRQYMELQQMTAMTDSDANLEVPYSSDQMAILTQLVLNGGHPMITPSRTLVFVHAVQQPLGTPEFVLLPITRSMPATEQGTGLANGFDPISAWRTLNSNYAVLLGALHIHGMSTAQVDINGTWKEYLDVTTEPAPTVLPTQAHVDTIALSSDPNDLSEPTQGLIPADQTNTRYTAYYLPEVDILWFAAPFDSLQGFGPPSSLPSLAAPMHRFSDTKHRRVYYQATSTSRFREYFPPDTKNFTRTSERLLVNVPSSARPLAPKVAYVVPTFGIERQETTNIKTDVRIGNGVRVYLNRPWYSSGEGELLGVVLWSASGPALTNDDRETYKHYITQWGLDPTWETGSLQELPQMSAPAAQGQGLSLAETSAITVDVAGYVPGYDASRKLWYCDITFSNPFAYQPFVHLALARYQPSSLPGVELSHVVLADYVQIAPDRSAVVSIDPADPRRARVFVGGNAPQGPNPSVFYVTVEQKMANVVSDLAWSPALSSVVTVTEDSPAPAQPDAVLWSGTVAFAAAPPAGQFRVVIKECEQIPCDPSPQEVQSTVLGQRVVYASIIPFDFPSTAQ